MGRALVRHPKVFLFDEPLSNLDAKLRGQMRLQIRRIHDRLDTTTIYVTHDQIEAMTMADDIVVMRGGKIEQMGSPETVYDAPANCFVADFIGSPSINFLDGVVERGGPDGAGVVRAAGHAIPLPPGNTAEDGGRVRLGLRPLDIDVVAGGAGTVRSGAGEAGKAGGTGGTGGVGETGGASGRGGTVRSDGRSGSDGVVGAGAVDAGEIHGAVDFIENTGAESHAHVRVGDTVLRAVSPDRLRLERGAPLTLRIDPAKVHVFDADSERRIA